MPALNWIKPTKSQIEAAIRQTIPDGQIEERNRLGKVEQILKRKEILASMDMPKLITATQKYANAYEINDEKGMAGSRTELWNAIRAGLRNFSYNESVIEPDKSTEVYVSKILARLGMGAAQHIGGGVSR